MRLINADCLEALKALPDCSIDAVVTDPPYGLNAMKSKDVAECLVAWASGETWEPRGRGFMGKSWDAWVPPPELWREVHRVLKPGGHALVFAGSRTQDLMSVALRLAGFEVRDTVQWLYGNGFPKSLDVSKALKDHPQAREWEGWGTALKPAYEPAILVRKELDGTVANNVLEHGVGGLNIEGGRFADPPPPRKGLVPRTRGFVGIKSAELIPAQPPSPLGRYPSNVILDEPASAALTEQAGDVSRFFYTSKALKPAYEPAILVRKELDGTVANNVLKDGTGAINIDACRFGDTSSLKVSTRKAHNGFDGKSFKANARTTRPHLAGRYPTNVLLDELASAALTEQASDVSRFFYTSKPSKKEREAGLDATGGQRANVHPTVKPIDLMRYLCRLITPPNGTVLDPFMGSGSTGCAAALEGFDFVGIEREAEYFEIAQRRIEHWRNEAKNAEPKQGRLL